MKNIINFRPILFSFVSLALGIRFARDIFSANIFVLSFLFLLLIALLSISIFQKKFLSLIVVICSFAIGMGLFVVDYNNFKPKDYVGNVTVVGRVSDDLDGKGGVLITNVTVNGEKAGNVYVYITSTEESLGVGDYITFTTELESQKLESFGKINTYYYKNNQKYFAYASLTKDGIAKGNPNLSESFKLAVKNGLYQNMSEQGAELAYSVLFGNKQDLNEDIFSNFTAIGVGHLLAVSGLHVGVLAGGLYFVLSKLKCKYYIQFIITAIILFVYCYLCGFNASVTRATIMIIIFLSAKLFGKRYDILNSISVAGLLILLFRPLYVFDLGFLLSFVCVFSIAIISKPINNFFLSIKIPKFLASPLAITISTQIGILPFMANYFGNFSIFTFIANLICIPIFSLAYTLLFICLLLLPFKFVNIVLFLPDVLFLAIISIANFISGAEFSFIKLFEIDYITILIFFISLFFLSSFVMLKGKIKIPIFCVLICVAFCYSVAINLPATPNTYTFTYIDSKSSNALITANGKVFYVGELSEEGENCLKFYKYNVDYFISNEDVVNFSNLISDNFLIDNIEIKFYKYDNKAIAFSFNVDNNTILYPFEKLEDYQILDIGYELMNNNVILVCDYSDINLKEEIISDFYITKNTNDKDCFPIKKFGSFSVNLEKNNFGEVNIL